MPEKIRSRFIAALLVALVGFSVVLPVGAGTETPRVLFKTVEIDGLDISIGKLATPVHRWCCCCMGFPRPRICSGT